MSVSIIPEMYRVSYDIAEQRAPRFENRFKSRKLRLAVADDPRLVELVEGVVGYLGDIGGALWLGLHWKEQLRNMVLRTDLLSHRDDYDLLHRGWKVDPKVEDFGPDHEDLVRRIVNHEINKNEVYGERLVNAEQFDENYDAEADIYLYSCLNKLDPREADMWYPVGWIFRTRIRKLGGPQTRSSSGRRLPSPAYLIPNDELEDPRTLVKIEERSAPARPPDPRSLSDSRQREFAKLVRDLGLE